MLTAWFINNQTKWGKEVQWHVGESKPAVNEAIYSIQADGHELEYIYKHFSNIPKVDNKWVVLYHNPFAQFIWNNIDGG